MDRQPEPVGRTWQKPMTTMLLTVGLLSILTPMAAGGVDITMTETRHGKVDSTRPTQSRSDATGSQFSPEQWGLDESEWARYLGLMQGIRGSISPRTLSPIEVLGIHARSDAERKKYARLWAKIMRDDAERILAFQRAYDAAWRELNPSGQLIDVSKLPQPKNDPAIQAGDRVLLFLRLADCPECQGLYTRVRRAAHEANAQLDIYFTGTKPGKDDEAIRAWVARQNFDPDRINRRNITFNHDNGTLSRTGGVAATSPATFRIRNDTLEPITIGMSGL